MENLEKLIDKICSYNVDSESFENYQRVINCCYDCFKLTKFNCLEKDEIENINKGIQIWNNNYDPKLLERLFLKTLKTIRPSKKNELRIRMLELGSSLLHSYESWEDDKNSQVYRPQMLDFYIGKLQYIGVDHNKIYERICNHYPEFVEMK